MLSPKFQSELSFTEKITSNFWLQYYYSAQDLWTFQLVLDSHRKKVNNTVSGYTTLWSTSLWKYKLATEWGMGIGKAFLQKKSITPKMVHFQWSSTLSHYLGSSFQVRGLEIMIISIVSKLIQEYGRQKLWSKFF